MNEKKTNNWLILKYECETIFHKLVPKCPDTKCLTNNSVLLPKCSLSEAY